MTDLARPTSFVFATVFVRGRKISEREARVCGGKLVGKIQEPIRLVSWVTTDYVSGLCAAIRTNHEPLRGSAQFAHNSVSSKSKKARRIGSQTQEIAMGHETIEWLLRTTRTNICNAC